MDVKTRLGRVHADARGRARACGKHRRRSRPAPACRPSSLITDMNEPLASAAGNAVEVRNRDRLPAPAESGTCGSHGSRWRSAAELLAARRACQVRSPEGERRMERRTLGSGRAAGAFERMVAALGGPRGHSGPRRRGLSWAGLVVEAAPEQRGMVRGRRRARGRPRGRRTRRRPRARHRRDRPFGRPDGARRPRRRGQPRPASGARPRPRRRLGRCGGQRLRAAYRLGDATPARRPGGPERTSSRRSDDLFAAPERDAATWRARLAALPPGRRGARRAFRRRERPLRPVWRRPIVLRRKARPIRFDLQVRCALAYCLSGRN